MSKIIACIAEGSAEKAIIEILLEHDKLIFSTNELIDYQVLSGYYRNPKYFERDYLQYHFDNDEIIIYYILDSKKVAKKEFKVSRLYRDFITVIPAITNPEIEILFIIGEGKYHEYMTKFKNKFKPSEYVKQHLKQPKVKHYDFVKEYFKDIDKLLSVLKIYCKGKKNTICDLLKS